MLRSWDELLEIATGGLMRAARALDDEQAVRGLDALDERDIQSVLAGAFEGAGLGVFREWPYTVPEGFRARKSDRERCDLVLTAGPAERPRDPVAERVERERAAGTLFAGMLADAPAADGSAGETVWLEVKVAGQFAYAAGVPGPSRGYSSLLVGALREDVAKLASEDGVGARGVLLVLFASSRGVTDHDVPAALHRCLDWGLGVGTSIAAGFPITDRIGNAWCAVWLVPVR